MSEIQQLKKKVELMEERMKRVEDQLNLSSKESSKGIQKQDMVVSKLEPTIDIKPHDILTIEGVINLINIRNWERLKQFKLQAKIVVVSTRETSKYGKTRPQKIIIADEKNNRFKLLNWHKSMEEELRDLKDQWVVFDSVYLKENDIRFQDNQFMFFSIKGEDIQFSIHSSKKFKIIFSISQKILGGNEK